MKAIVLQCSPGSRFHFGLHAPDADTALSDTGHIIHNDTLYAALLNTWQDAWGDAQALADAFENEQLRISSGFHCLHNGQQYTWFLPKPASFDRFDADDYKPFRKIQFISAGLWRTIRHPADLMTDANVIILNNSHALLRSELLPQHAAEHHKIAVCKTILLPKVQVRKPTQEDVLYQLAVTELVDNSVAAPGLVVHYYFLADDSQLPDVLRPRWRAVLELLADSGIGAERSTLGQLEGFISVEDDWQLLDEAVQDPDWVCSLGLVSPASAEEIKQMPCYKTILRGGRRLGRDGAWQKIVHLACEGAIVGKNVKGQTISVTPDGHDGIFLRYGKPITLPVHKQWIQHE